MRLSVIINTLNEGGRVGSTCASFLAHGADEVVVCADGTTDGSCDTLPERCVVVRNPAPIGCGKSKFKATQHATGDVLMWVDAHQCVLDGDLRAMAERSFRESLVICPALTNIFYPPDWIPQRMPNSRLFFPNEDCLLPDSTAQYRFTPARETICVGVGLCMSRRTYLQTGGWNRFAGRHGSQERGMSLRAFMAGIPVEVDGKTVLGHEFYGSNHPSRNASTGQYRFNNIAPSAFNAWHSYMAVCGPQTFEAEIRPWLMQFKGSDSASKGAATKEALADRDHFLRNCKRMPDADLTALIDRLWRVRPVEKDPGTAALEPAALRILRAMARGRCLELGSGSGASTKALLAGAMSVVSVDHMAKFTGQAAATVNDDRAEFITRPINPETGCYDLSTIAGKFDCILIDGPPGTAARRNGIRTVLPLLAEGGVILQDDAKRDLEGISAQCSELGLSRELLRTHRGIALVRREKKVLAHGAAGLILSAVN